jgi:MFS family permease
MARLPHFGRATRVLRYSNWVAAALVTLCAVYLHALFFLNAGGLWRDECELVHLSLLPSFSEVWQKLPHDSCPILMHLAVRAWSAAASHGNTDPGLRVLGLYVGLFSLLAFWLASWTMRNGAPLLAVTLAGLNVTMVRAGDSLRGYGLGSALAVLTLAVIWRLTCRPSLAAFSCAVAVAVLSVQSLYQNAFLLLAACCGGFVLCAVERRWRDTLPIFAVGIAAAVSLLPYIPLIIRAQDWYIIMKVGFRFSRGWEEFSLATGSPLTGFTWVWVALWIGALAAAISVLFGRRDRLPEHFRGLILFAGTSLVVGAAGYALFLKLSEYPTQPWNYVPLMAFSAVCLDAIFFTAWRWARPAAMILAVVTISMAFLFELPAVKCRQTNVDLIAAGLSSEVAPNDYVIVHPWYCGVTFQRYYKATASWTTLPPLDDYTLQRYDLFKAKIQTKDPIAPVIDRITSTLQSGNRVWLVGNIPFTQQPAPEPKGWFAGPYSFYWGVQVSQFLSAHCQRSAVVIAPPTNCVNPVENLSVFVMTGWKP